MTTTRPRSAVLIAVFAGLAFGALTSMINAIDEPVGVFLSQIFCLGWSWAAFGVVAGAVAVRAVDEEPWWAAPAAGTAALLAAVPAYYGIDLYRGVADHIDPATDQIYTNWSGLVGQTLFWSIGALVLGPMLGLVGAYLHRESVLGMLAQLVVPAAALVNIALQMPTEVLVQPRPAALIGQWLIVVVAGIAVVWAIASALLRQQRAAAAR